MNALDMSKQQVLKTMTDGGIVLAHATAARMVAVHTLTPASRDPVRHLQEAHAQARTHLVRLTVHDPSHEIASFMTNELFSRLTVAQPRPLTPPAGVGRYTYTPRKALRRVLDHALDHLNQIDQWRAWQRDGVVPTPTDGWVGSSVTLPGDLLPLSGSDLDAWAMAHRSGSPARPTARRRTHRGRTRLAAARRRLAPPPRVASPCPVGTALRSFHRRGPSRRRPYGSLRGGLPASRRDPADTRGWEARTRRSCTRDSTVFSRAGRRSSTGCWPLRASYWARAPSSRSEDPRLRIVGGQRVAVEASR
jgi:hypothetical protein